MCDRCSYYIAPDGCACGQIERLLPGGALHHVSSRSMQNFKSPHYSDDCICPDCFMKRRWDWDCSRLNIERPKHLRKAH